MEHLNDVSGAAVMKWLNKHDLTEFKSQARFSKLVARGIIDIKKTVQNRRLYDTKTVLSNLRKANLLRDNAGLTLSEMPPPLEGQTQEEYSKTVVASLGADPTINEANIFYTIYRGKLAQQKYDIEAERLVYRSEVEDKAFSTARVIRDQLLTIPERMSAEIATKSDPVEIRELLYAEIIKTLSIISTGTPFVR